jgi:phosphatidylglycerophosphate synthase
MRIVVQSGQDTQAGHRVAASSLARLVVSPNQISLASVLAAGPGGTQPVPLSAAVAGAGLHCRRSAACLPCNLLDGMVAVEHGRKFPLGVLYKEFPDRVADSVIYVCEVPWLGWLGALWAALTAYVRVFGKSSWEPTVVACAIAAPLHQPQNRPQMFPSSWRPSVGNANRIDQPQQAAR